MNVVPIKSQKTILMEFRKIILLDLVFLINLPSSLSAQNCVCCLALVIVLKRIQFSWQMQIAEGNFTIVLRISCCEYVNSSSVEVYFMFDN